MVGPCGLEPQTSAVSIPPRVPIFSQTQRIFLNGGGGSPVALTITDPNAVQVYSQPRRL